jgi:FkbM family methyltransferase
MKLYNGIICNVHEFNDYISTTIKRYGIWEPNVTYWIERLSNGGIFIDVGSNIGYCSLIASKVYSNVYSFEPVPENFTLFQKSIDDNNIKNLKLITKCVGKTDNETLELSSFKHNMGGTRNIKNTIKQDVSRLVIDSTRDYDVITLDTFTDNLGVIDLIKIDVEGHELEVLKGFVKNIKKCTAFIIELSPCCLPNQTCIDILDFLKNNHYFIYDIGLCETGNTVKSTGCKEIFDFKTFVTSFNQTNIIASQTKINESF